MRGSMHKSTTSNSDLTRLLKGNSNNVGTGGAQSTYTKTPATQDHGGDGTAKSYWNMALDFFSLTSQRGGA